MALKNGAPQSPMKALFICFRAQGRYTWRALETVSKPPNLTSSPSLVGMHARPSCVESSLVPCAWVPGCAVSESPNPRGRTDDVNMRILQTMAAGILVVFGLSIRMLDPYVYVVSGAAKSRLLREDVTLHSKPMACLEALGTEPLNTGPIPRTIIELTQIKPITDTTSRVTSPVISGY